MNRTQTDNKINFLDLTEKMSNSTINFNIHRKPTQIDNSPNVTLTVHKKLLISIPYCTKTRTKRPTDIFNHDNEYNII